MKRLDDKALLTQPVIRLKYLVALTAALMAAPIAQADIANKKIGDLEIYKAAEGGKVTITMMLDTSGSMSALVSNVGAEACDLPTGISSNGIKTLNSTTSQDYPRTYCEVIDKKYFYKKTTSGRRTTWYSCDGSTSCNTVISAPSTSGYTEESGGRGSNDTYYYKNIEGNRYYDRLTRLKDALFALMDNTQLDATKVAIGIGQYSAQSDDDNYYIGADGTSGKIVVPAKLLDQTQRIAIKKAVAALKGENGTPTANAYAEVGAYMLGTNTSTTVTYPREEYRYAGSDRYYGDYYSQCVSWNAERCTGLGNAYYISTYGYTTAYCKYYNGICLTKDKTQSSKDWGYSGFSKSISASKTNNNYISPISSGNSTCDGRGIYFLTDGEPNSSPIPLPLMKSALGTKGSSFTVPSNTLPNGSQNGNGMPEVGAFARALRNASLNPLGQNKEILTAVVGFGSVFDVDKEADAAKSEADRIIRRITYIDTRGSLKTSDFYNCTKISDIDAKNACNWGAKSHPSLPGVGGFGEGGFYSAQSTEDIVNSIITFVSDLDQTLPSIPSGTIVIPDDPYRADSQLAVAYYPTLQPKVAEKVAIWEGNMKKYALKDGTLFGINESKLFKNVAGELNNNAPDLWSDGDYSGANDKVEAGGYYANLKTPNSGPSSVRTLFIEDSDASNKPVLKKFGVNSAGKVTVDNVPLSPSSFQDTATYNETTLRKLLNFLGFDRLPGTNILVKDMTLSVNNTSNPIKVVGATIHSTPASVSYSATLDANGKVTDKRDDYVLFGSSEGGLHLVDAGDYSATGDGGKEKFVIIPKKMLQDARQSESLVKGATVNQIGVPNFGIDAPWLVTADYKYDFENKKVTIDTTNKKGVFAYGGLRMGGEAMYGVDLTKNNDPKILFAITPATTGFSQLGQIWSKPTKAKIKTSTSDTGTDVLVFGGGYDMCYEYDTFQVGVTDSALGDCSGKPSARGNAVYIVNARTGDLIWSASNSNANTTVNNMTNSVVGGVTVLDRNNDGFMDHIYFADLGGQVFRADFTNAGFKKPVSPTEEPTAETSFTNTRVTRILKSAYSGTDTRFNYRFYERPVISFYRNDGGSLFALINVISGDRSSPLSVLRDNNKYADRLYGIIDSDVSKADNIFYADNFTSSSNIQGQKVANLTDSNLASLPLILGGANSTTYAESYSKAQKERAINTFKTGSKQGWYYPLIRFEGFNNVRYTKGMGKSEVLDSFLYTTVYNPDMSYGTSDACTAKVVGGSERQLYCLPYGICMDDASKNGTGGYTRAGQGIQELTLGPRSSTFNNQRLLIGTQTLSERVQNRVDFGFDEKKGTDSPIYSIQSLQRDDQAKGGSGTAPELIYNERFTLQPKIWYEVD